MARIFLNSELLDEKQRWLLPFLERLPDTYWIFASPKLWRSPDWLILRTGPASHVFAVTQFSTNLPLRGYQNSAWEQQGPDGWWRPVEQDTKDDVNPLDRAVNISDAAAIWLRERTTLTDAGRCWPLLMIRLQGDVRAHTPETPIDGWGRAIRQPEEFLEYLEEFVPPASERIVLSYEDVDRLAPLIAGTNGLKLHKPGAFRSATRGGLTQPWRVAAVLAGLAILAAVAFALSGRAQGEAMMQQSPIGSSLGSLNPFANAAQAGYCPAGQRPAFMLGFADLKAALGAGMGEPIECEHKDDASDDIHQRTTTGLAYFRPEVNMPSFTNGSEHWALTGRGLVHWQGDSVAPPPNATLVRGN